MLKPGSSEPWSPFRIIQAFIKAGCPPEAFCYFPADHAGAGEILRRTGRSMFFGDVTAVGSWEGDPRVEIHGPGYSKVLIADDQLDTWEQHAGADRRIDRRQRRTIMRECVRSMGERIPRRARGARRLREGWSRSSLAEWTTSARGSRRLPIPRSQSGFRRRSISASILPAPERSQLNS